MIAAHLRTTTARDMTDAELDPYLQPWLGASGQAAYYRQVAQFDERYTREIEPRYGQISTPTLVLWGEQDGWLAPESGRRLADEGFPANADDVGQSRFPPSPVNSVTSSNVPSPRLRYRA